MIKKRNILTVGLVAVGLMSSLSIKAHATPRKDDAEAHHLSRVSPLPAAAESISLNGTWNFLESVPAGFPEKVESLTKKITVPGEWLMQGYEVKKETPAAYHRTFTVPESMRGQRVRIRFDGVYSTCHVYVNGKKAGTRTSAFLPFELDVTDLISIGSENQLALTVQSESLADTMAKGSHYAKHQIGGINREVTLFALPQTHVSDIGVRPVLDKNYHNATLMLSLGVTNDSAQTQTGLSASLHLTPLGIKGVDADFNGQSKELSQVELGDLKAKGTFSTELSCPVENPEKWHAEHPFLYQLQIRLKQDGKVIETINQRVGFRSIETKDNQVFINGKRLKLRGVCRHSIHPLTGRTTTPELVEQDLKLFREANCNFIRTSHYPPEKQLLDLCDEMGMFVMDEAPICWSNATEASKPYVMRVTQELYYRDRNHPSVIIWSQANESRWSKAYEESVEMLKKLDQDRLVMFSHSEYYGIQGRGLLDIGTKHYPGADGPRKYENYFRPIIYDEFLHLNAYNEREFLTDPGVRDQWSRYACQMWTNILTSRGSLGGSVWAGIDEVFFLPKDKSTGYGPWGIIDGWRREKPEFWGLKKAYSPVKVALKNYQLVDGQIILDVENRYDSIDFSGLGIDWKYGDLKGRVHSRLPAGNTGHFIVKLPAGAADRGVLELEITDHQGVAIDKYHLPIGPLSHDLKPTPAVTKKLTFTEDENVYRVGGSDFEILVSKRSGLMEQGTFNGIPLINNGPSLMILPLDNNKVRVVDNIPILKDDAANYSAFLSGVCQQWSCEGIDLVKRSATEIQFKVTGAYKEASGFYIYTIRGDGSFDIEYTFIVKQDVRPRQLGIVLACDKACQTLEWNRKGQFSVYPPDHIARLQGTAQAFYPDTLCGIYGPRTKPAHSWSKDANAYGSNDFRSTKHHIYSAKLLNPAKRGLHVISDASQHVRCWVEDDQTKLLTAYFSHAGAEHYLRHQTSQDVVELKAAEQEANLVADKVRYQFAR
ncbi:MAG: glycoside hydrolase family 2 [Akkermansiaceae bacterium]|nr:glycoside hydrolase family 2 [Akkermansiaceae bacterium]